MGQSGMPKVSRKPLHSQVRRVCQGDAKRNQEKDRVHRYAQTNRHTCQHRHRPRFHKRSLFHNASFY